MSISTATSTNLAPTITSLGVGSGLNLNAIVTQLVAVERQPLTQLQSAAATLQTQLSDFGQVSSLMSTLQSAATALGNPSLWQQTQATSSNSSAVSASGGSGTNPGNYAVTVQQLANTQTVASGTTFASAGSLVGSGSLTLQLGSWDSTNTVFSAKSGTSATTLTIGATDTVQSVADKINAAGMGVTATLITDSTGVRLALSSSSSGAANGFRVDAVDSDGTNTDSTGLSALAYDPTTGANAMTLTQSAADAKATINGIAVQSASNNLSTVINGLTLTLSQVSAAPVNISVAQDTSGVTNAVQAFVGAFNGIANYLTTSTAYNASTQVAGDLLGNSTANNLQQLLRNTLSASTGASSVFKTLSDVGLQFQRDGTIKLDSTALSNAEQNLPELQKAFTTASLSNPGSNGFATNFNNLAQNVLGPGGLVTNQTSSLQTQLTANGTAQSTLNSHVAAYQQTLVAQYTALDAQLASLSALSSYVTQQLNAMSGTNSSSSSSSA
ncbi:MAG: flagellar filament capping protein FliD [Burkholderiales bacterium]|nr:flagellar filament capping protein FliD [Burkholderiales bacterium]MDE1927232.1 flagellar filament capping protein FliD [Burkholderiales bacterium]MDE2501566.1 flagellar filament capping protein FliD [Burkholderiales bacterium]